MEGEQAADLIWINELKQTLPRGFRSAAVWSASALSRSQIATLAPPDRSTSTTARPMPWAPPVTTAERLVKSYFVVMAAPD